MIQFVHRWLGIVVFLSMIGVSGLILRSAPNLPQAIGAVSLLIIALVQVVLGILTIMLAMPISVAVAHQGGALILLLTIIFVWHQLQTGNIAR